MRANESARVRDVGELFENRGEAITRDEKKKRRDRFGSMEALLPADAAPHEPPVSLG